MLYVSLKLIKKESKINIHLCLIRNCIQYWGKKYAEVT